MPPPPSSSMVVALLLILLPILVLQHPNPAQTATIQRRSIANQPLATNLEQHKTTNQLLLQTNQQHQHQEEQPHHLPSKFLLLTTGDQIKLYPFGRQTNNQQKRAQGSSTLNQDELSDEHYIVKPKELNVDDLFELYMYGKSTFINWLRYKSQRRAFLNLTTTNKKKSILPESQMDDDEGLEYGSHHGWQRPNIVKVDYFFNPDFCDHNDGDEDDDDDDNDDGDKHNTLRKKEQCLVIFWLDKSNNYIRYGSIDLAKTPLGGGGNIEPPSNVDNTIEAPSRNNKRNKQKVLWLKEFTPIPLNYFVPEVAKNDIDPHDMVVDRQQYRLIIAMTVRNLSLIVSNDFYKHYMDINGLKLRVIKHCDSLTPKMKNLNIDESNRDWLFYSTGSTINAVDMFGIPETTDDKLKPGSVGLLAATRYIVTCIPDDHDGQQQQITAGNRNESGMTLDSTTRQLYWLTERNELFRSDYAGLNVELVGKLAQKPAIWSIGDMQVVQGTLYLNDPTRRSLIAYKLPKQEIMRPSTELDNMNDDDDGLMIRAESSIEPEQTINELTNQVLVVETPTVKGFKVVDLERVSVLASSPTASASDVTQQKVNNYKSTYDRDMDHGSWGKGLFFFVGGAQEKDEYDLLLERRASCYPEYTPQMKLFFQLLFILILLLYCVRYFVVAKKQVPNADDEPEKIPV